MQDDLVRLAAFAGLLSAMVIYIAAGGALQRAESSLAGGTQSAAVFFVPSITLAKINSDYQKQVRILIVPGHQPDTGGTEYNGVYERDVVVDIASARSRAIFSLARLDESAFVGSKKSLIAEKRREMHDAASRLDFETAALLRDEIKQLESLK